MSREYTREEVRSKFLKHVESLVVYWEKESRREDVRGKLEGLAFSIMSTLDGCSAALPGFIVAPCPHDSDKQYHIDGGEDYYPENHESNVQCDIGGELHELIFKDKD